MHSETVLLIALLVLFAGCSGIASDPEANTTPATSTTTASTTTASTSTTTTTASTTTPKGTLEVHFINVGQSVSTLLVGPTGETMLVDTGHYQDDGEHVLSYLKAHDITRIDYLVVSHNDADHIGGNAAIIEYYETEAEDIGAIYDPGIAASTQTYEAYLDAVERHVIKTQSYTLRLRTKG